MESKKSPSAIQLAVVNYKSDKWNKARNKCYQVIYASIKSSEYCSNAKSLRNIGTVPEAIIAEIANCVVSMVNVLSCYLCTKKIDFYVFELTNKLNIHSGNYFVSDDCCVCSECRELYVIE
eukprot:398132_1